jgi:hypothetical protein
VSGDTGPADAAAAVGGLAATEMGAVA